MKIFHAEAQRKNEVISHAENAEEEKRILEENLTFLIPEILYPI
jgi:hypothetical protein